MLFLLSHFSLILVVYIIIWHIPFLYSCRQCTGMSELAYNLLTTEDSAEWVCDKCVTTKYIPTVRMVPTKSWSTYSNNLSYNYSFANASSSDHWHRSLIALAFQNTKLISFFLCHIIFFTIIKRFKYIQGDLYTMSHIHTRTFYDVNFLDLALDLFKRN